MERRSFLVPPGKAEGALGWSGGRTFRTSLRGLLERNVNRPWELRRPKVGPPWNRRGVYEPPYD